MAKKSNLAQRAINLYLDRLEADGIRILKECEAEKDYMHDTKNLYDSYGFGVYYNGKLERKGFLSAAATAKKSKKWYGQSLSGRTEIESYLNNNIPAEKGFSLKVVAVMPYGKVLEEGGGGVKRKYKVISMSYDKLRAIAPSYDKDAKVKAVFR